MDDLPHLFEELMAFVAVVDAGGFNAAGERFGVPPSRWGENGTGDAVLGAVPKLDQLAVWDTVLGY